MKEILGAVLLSYLAIAHCDVAIASDGGRCKMTSGDKLVAMSKLGIVEVCQQIDPSVGGGDLFDKAIKVVIEGVTYVGSGGLITAGTDGVVMFDRGGSAVKFAVPSDPKYSDYVVCSFHVGALSTIPKPGKYLKHGWENYTERSVTHGWYLRDRGGTYGASRLHADLYFTFLPRANLDVARSEKLCLSDPKAEASKHWR